MKMKTILDEAKAQTESKTGYAAAKALHIKHNTFYQYESGIRVPDVTVCVKLAAFTGVPLTDVIAAAESAKKLSWKRYGKAAGYATIAPLLMTLAIGAVMPLASHIGDAWTLYIM